MGRLLVQHEVNTTLSIQFPQLALLLASLVQFGNGASISCSTGFARVELNREDGLSVTVSTDTIANVATAVVTRLQPDVNSCDYDVLEFARLQSLVILKALVTMNAHAVEQAVEANRAIIEKQAEEYTLSNALNHRMIDEQGGTLEEFVTFQRDVVDRVMMISPNQTISISNKDNLAAITSASIINAENGHNVYHSIPSPHDLPRIVSALTQRAASALHRAYPLLVQTLRFQRHTGSSNIEFVNRHSSLLTIVLQFPTNTSEDQTLVAIRMLSLGVFASVISFRGVNSRFTTGYENNTMSAEDLQRVLISDTRGSSLLQLVEEGVKAQSDFKLHIGSDGVPDHVLAALEAVLSPWERWSEKNR